VVVTFLDADYPQTLRSIPDAPIVLYVCGAFPAEDDVVIAIVGARGATLYGLETAERLSRELTEMGVVIVSGLARGIDAAAHRGCLKASGRTVGVLGCGLDVVYPRENQDLFRLMMDKGCVISEFPLGTQPHPYNFPRRNRIVSGLSSGVVVVEAGQKSGALITAEFALEQGKDVFAVPGRVDNRMSEGPHALIRQGAKLVLSVEDILEEFPIRRQKEESASAPDGISEDSRDNALGFEEKRLLAFIAQSPRTLEELTTLTGLSTVSLMGPLLSLQLSRRITERPGKIYQKRDI
jgi:DNA processing protein